MPQNSKEEFCHQRARTSSRTSWTLEDERQCRAGKSLKCYKIYPYQCEHAERHLNVNILEQDGCVSDPLTLLPLGWARKMSYGDELFFSAVMLLPVKGLYKQIGLAKLFPLRDEF